MALVKLNDPELKKYNDHWRSVYADRARKALIDEEIAYDEDLIFGLVQAAWRLHSKVPPGIFRVGAKETVDSYRKISDTGKILERDLSCISKRINDAHPWIRDEIREQLASRNVDENTFNAVFEALESAAKSIAHWEAPSSITELVKQGNNQKPKSAWVLLLWPFLDKSGASMKSAGRVLSRVFHGDDSASESIYQAIRNHVIR